MCAVETAFTQIRRRRTKRKERRNQIERPNTNNNAGRTTIQQIRPESYNTLWITHSLTHTHSYTSQQPYSHIAISFSLSLRSIIAPILPFVRPLLPPLVSSSCFAHQSYQAKPSRRDYTNNTYKYAQFHVQEKITLICASGILVYSHTNKPAQSRR